LYRVTQTFQFLMSVDVNQIGYQLTWLYKQFEQNNKSFDFVVIDMVMFKIIKLRYVLRVMDNTEPKFIMLDRLVNHCWSKPVLFEYARQAIFFDWFVYDNLSDDRLWELSLAGLRILQMYSSQLPRPQIFERMLEYILQQQVRT
jgi:hypothetical protein